MTQMPDFTDYFIGYRAWKVERANTEEVIGPHFLRLLSMTHNSGFLPWEKEVPEAACLSSVRVEGSLLEPCLAPGSNCHCGYNAFHDLSDAVEYLRLKYLTEQLSPNKSGLDYYILGSVRGWGRCEVHENGWRSQFVEVVAISSPNSPKLDRDVFARSMPPQSTLVIPPSCISELEEYYHVPYMPVEDLVAYTETQGSSVPLDARPEATPLVPLDRVSTLYIPPLSFWVKAKGGILPIANPQILPVSTTFHVKMEQDMEVYSAGMALDGLWLEQLVASLVVILGFTFWMLTTNFFFLALEAIALLLGSPPRARSRRAERCTQAIINLHR